MRSLVQNQISAGLLALSRRLSCHRVEDMVAAKHVLRYLRGTIDYELCFKKCDGDLNLQANPAISNSVNPFPTKGFPINE